MPATITLRDETASGTLLRERTLDFLTDDITVRELITRRVQEEVRDFNRRIGDDVFVGLVQPTGAEAELNGYHLRKRRELSWEQQRDAAIAGFEANGFFVLVGDRQVESLDERIRVGVGTEVSFIKLVPLVGG
jgi:hypothetical protein